MVERPKTPEEVKKKCLNCEPMGDFIKGLQGEIKRLQVSYYFSVSKSYLIFYS